MNKALAIFLSVCCLLSLGLSINNSIRVKEEKIDYDKLSEVVITKMKERETEYIQKMTPKFRQIYTDMFGTEDRNYEEFNPQNLHELFEPMFELIEALGQ